MRTPSFPKDTRAHLFLVKSPGESLPSPNPAAAKMEYERGCSLEAAGKVNEATSAYRSALGHDPHHADAHVNLGRIVYESGHHDEALSHFRAAQETRPTDAVAAFNTAVALDALGRLDEALEAYAHAIGLDSNLADAHYNMALLYQRWRHNGSARRHYETYRALTGERADII